MDCGGPDSVLTRYARRIERFVRGIIHPSVPVVVGMKIGDLDPRTDSAYCFTVSDKALAVGGGVLEAILALNNPANPTNLN